MLILPYIPFCTVTAAADIGLLVDPKIGYFYFIIQMRFLKNRSLWAVATLTKAMALHCSDISLFISCILNYKDANRPYGPHFLC